MDSGYSGLRNWIVLALVLILLAIASNFYLATEIARNSDELDRIYRLLQKQLMGKALAQSQELQKRMESLNQTASGIDARMKQAEEQMDARLRKAQDDFVVRMWNELPKIMDNYARTRASAVQGLLKQQGIPKP